MGCDFEAFIRKRGDRYLLAAPEYGVVLSSSDSAAGMRELEARVAAVVAEFEQAGFEAPKPRLPDKDNDLGGQVIPFLIKTAAVSTVIALLLLMASLPLANAVIGLRHTIRESIDNTLARLPRVANAETLGRVGINWIVRFGDAVERVTPERKAELQLAVRKIVQGLGPVMEGVRPLLNSQTPSGPEPRQ